MNPPIQAAASVILLGDDPKGTEPFAVFMLRRRAQSRFMPGRYVFPGGRVDPIDDTAGMDADTFMACALRELWEESGVILAEECERAACLPGCAREEARRALLRTELDLEEALAWLGLSPDYACLVPYARWVTPRARPQRFDTVFYLAAMPAGQKAAADRVETQEGVWVGPQRALALNESGEVSLAPPQVRILGELADFGSLAELLAREWEPGQPPVRPELWVEGRRRVLLFPWDPDHRYRAPQDVENLGRPCPAGRASRLLHVKGRWLPYEPA